MHKPEKLTRSPYVHATAVAQVGRPINFNFGDEFAISLLVGCRLLSAKFVVGGRRLTAEVVVVLAADKYGAVNIASGRGEKRVRARSASRFFDGA